MSILRNRVSIGVATPAASGSAWATATVPAPARTGPKLDGAMSNQGIPDLEAKWQHDLQDNAARLAASLRHMIQNFNKTIGYGQASTGELQRTGATFSERTLRNVMECITRAGEIIGPRMLQDGLDRLMEGGRLYAEHQAELDRLRKRATVSGLPRPTRFESDSPHFLTELPIDSPEREVCQAAFDAFSWLVPMDRLLRDNEPWREALTDVADRLDAVLGARAPKASRGESPQGTPRMECAKRIREFLAFVETLDADAVGDRICPPNRPTLQAKWDAVCKAANVATRTVLRNAPTDPNRMIVQEAIDPADREVIDTLRAAVIETALTRYAPDGRLWEAAIAQQVEPPPVGQIVVEADRLRKLRAVARLLDPSQEPQAITTAIDPAMLARLDAAAAAIPAVLEGNRAGIERVAGAIESLRARNDDEAPAAKLPELKAHDRQAWQLATLHGMIQDKVAAALNKEHGTTYTQGQVSRMIARAKAHARANGLAEKVAGPIDRPRAVDPGRLELGARVDKRAPRPSDLTRSGDE
jgi:hypothetical protein